MHVSWLAFGGWGAFGVFAVEGVEVSATLRKGERPENLPFYLLSIAIRLVIGTGLAVAAGLNNQVNNPFGAISVGVSSPLILEQLARRVPLSSDGVPAARKDVDVLSGGSDPRQ